MSPSSKPTGRLASRAILAAGILAACGSPATSPSAVFSHGGVAIPLQTPPGGVGLGLQVWLRAGIGISAANGGNVLLWQDQSGHEVNASWNPTNAFGELPPVFDASNPGVNGAPTLRFNGASALEIDLTGLAGSDYTVIVMNGRDRFGLANFYIADDVIGKPANHRRLT
jgi:hypothetical protein